MSTVLRIAMALVLLGLSSGCCLIFRNVDRDMASQGLDLGTWSAQPCHDVDGDGRRDVILRTSLPGPGDGVEMKFGAWVLSGRDLAPFYAVDGVEPASGEGLWLIGSTRDKRDGREFLLAAWNPTTEETSEPPAARFALIAGAEGRLEALADDTPLKHFGPLELLQPPGWRFVALKQRKLPAWRLWDDVFVPDYHGLESLAAIQGRMTATYPGLKAFQACGDVDGDGSLDWLGLSAEEGPEPYAEDGFDLSPNPFIVCLISGSDARIVRTISMSSRPLATVATGGFELGDVDHDGISDWLFGLHVSQSDAHVAPRTCRLGLISIVSGADLRVITTLERESFLAGAGSRCPVVRVPD